MNDDHSAPPLADEVAGTFREKAASALRQGVFDLAGAALARERPDVAELIENLRIYQAELEIQNEELRHSQLTAERAMQRFATFFAALPVAALVVADNGVVEEANVEAQRLLRMSGTHLRRHFFHRLVAAQFQESVARAFQAARDDEDFMLEAVQFRRNAGDDFVGDLYVARLPGEQSGPLQFMCVIVDQSEYLHQRSALDKARRRLLESERFARAVIDSLEAQLCVLDEYGTIIAVNQSWQAFAAANGAPTGHYLGEDYLAVCDVTGEGKAFADGVRAVIRGERNAFSLEYPCHAPHCQRWFVARVTRLTGDGPVRVVVIHENVTDVKLAADALRLSAKVFDSSSEAIFITDGDNRILSVNRAFTELTGYTQEEVQGKNPRILGPGTPNREFFRKFWETLLQTGHWRGELWGKRKSGEIYPKWVSISALHDEEGRLTHYIAIFTDISERKATEERIEFLAHHDPLTGLPNRLLMRDRMDQALAQAAREEAKVALLFLDLDHFKHVNDSLGHPVGDRLLQEIVARLKDCVRVSDAISRQGGDEFLIILNNLENSSGAAQVAQKILETLVEPFQLDGFTLSTSFSIGISLYPDDGSDFDTLLKKADTAMYHAKEAGRNAYRFFTEAMNVKAVERMELEGRLRQAIEQGEFLLHYQPQVEAHSGTIVGGEALIRWNNPELGLVSPARFIPLAEDTGLIVPIGAWVLREACRQMRAWRDAGLAPVPIAVNLSALQFKRGDIVGEVAAVLAEYGLEAQSLELELTESILIQDVENTLETVKRLKSLGVKLSIDDFGTGYSSMSYLKRFAVDKLKVDQSFVRDLTKDPESAEIVRAIVQLGNNLRLRTIAEGVEDGAELAMLREYGCREVQGYYFSRPLPAEEFARVLRDGLKNKGTG